MVGVTVLSAYSLQIFAILNENGLKTPPQKGVLYIGIAAITGSLLSVVVSSRFKFKTIFTVGYGFLTVFAVGCALADVIKRPELLMIQYVAYFFVFRATIGNLTGAYTGRICEASASSLSIFTVYLVCLILSLTATQIFIALKPFGAFTLFASSNLICFIFSLTYFRDVHGLTEEQARKIYRKPIGHKSVLPKQVPEEKLESLGSGLAAGLAQIHNLHQIVDEMGDFVGGHYDDQGIMQMVA